MQENPCSKSSCPWLALIILSLTSTLTQAEQFGLFTYRDTGETIEIIDFPDDVTGHVDIPAEIDGKPVTSIGGATESNNLEGAFFGCGIGSVTIPDSVTHIGDSAFSICFNLSSVTIPDSVIEIGNSAFYQSNSLTAVTLGNNVRSIGDLAFFVCFRLESLTIPDSVTSIGERAFEGCWALSTLNLGNGLTDIGIAAFMQCGALESLTIPDSVTNISRHAFGNCGFTSITLGNGISTLEHGVFAKCENLTSVTFGNGLDTIGPTVFSRCTALTTITIPNTVTTIEHAAFQNCTNLASISIPDDVDSIGSFAFSGCDALKAVSFGSGIDEIAHLAFSRCSGLKSAVFNGDAPGSFSELVFDAAAADLKIYFLEGGSGFTAPQWNGHPSVMIDEDAQPAATWLLKYGFAHDANLQQDSNGDGVSLLMAYSLNLDPNKNTRASLPAPTITGNTLGMSFHATSPGITYSVQTSTDLLNWTSDGITVNLPDDDGKSFASVKHGAEGFFRVLVSED
ncbi:MAG: leucine-rich repeat domain-containing protein [Verrucomicrobiales bacterium]|nr:leucine-rich repeat domain-containing protein [Verrucomicrobiales bacterium]